MKFIIAFALFVTLASAGDVRANIGEHTLLGGPPRVERKLGGDSTIFTMSLPSGQHPKMGGTFLVNIHVTPGQEWHVYSTKMSTEGGLVPLTFMVPPELSDFFEVEKVEESGEVKTAYDSNFDAVTMAHFTPFDVSVTMKVKKKPTNDTPFYLWVHFQTCTETMCMPPRTFEVPMTFLGQAPIKLQIAAVLMRPPFELAEAYKPQ